MAKNQSYFSLETRSKMIAKAQTAAPTVDRAQAEMIDGCVDVSMSINQLFVHTLKAEKLSGKVDLDVSSISAAFEQLTASIEEIASSATQVRESSEQVSHSVDGGQAATERAIESMRSIASVVAEAKARTDVLNEAAQAIASSLGRIQSIANKTNLLALNATIQAARAGAAGRGFAVVANEVKQLSAQTTVTANEISGVLTELSGSLRDTSQAMDSVSAAVDEGESVSLELSECMRAIGQSAAENLGATSMITSALSQQSSAATEVSEAAQSIKAASHENMRLAVSNAGLGRGASLRMEGLIKALSSTAGADQFVVKLAKSDHLVWKRKFHDFLFGECKLTEADLTSHERCRLGHWYYGGARAAHGSSASYTKLEHPHKRVHDLGREIYERVNARDHDGAVGLLDEFEAVSKEVIELLDQLDREIG